ncbi:MAG: penicillin acylase family protein [Gammaproteobacteria bacterium]
MVMRLEADRLVSLLVHTMLGNDGRAAFKDDRFDGMWREIVEFFSSDCVPFKTVAPLPRLVIPESPLRLNSEIVLDRLTDEEDTRCWEVGVLRPSSPRFPFIETKVAIGIRKTTHVPKRIQADDEPSESPGEANTGSFGNRCPFREDLLIDDVLSALRLFKHTQLRSADHASWTDGYPLGGGASFRSLGQWPYGDACELSEADVPQFLEVWRLLEAGSDEMDFTLRRFNLSFERRLGDDRLVDLVIAAESLFLGDLADRGEVRFRFALRAAKFIEHTSYNERDVYRVMRRAYDARSAVVHGGSPEDTGLPDNKSASLQVFTDAIEEVVRLGLRAPEVTQRASNEWLVRPPLTRGGKTILLADPHVEMNSPAYYEYSLHAPGFESAGYAVGALLWQAYNRDVGWALTTGNPDLWDCYAVETSEANPREFLYDRKPQQMEVRKEVFRSASGKVVERDFEYTHHNGVLSAVVARQGRIAYAVSMSPGLYDDEVYRMNRATSVQELREAMKTLGSLPQNLMAADERGGAYYLRAGKTPKRPTGYDWTAAVPGNTSATAWLGIHPLEEMIEVLNPPQGYMQNNNTAPDRLFADGNLDPARYPAWTFNDRPGRVTTRGRRALDVLSRAKDFTVDDAKALAFDEYWITTPSWRGALANAVKHQRKSYRRLSVPARKLVDRISSFDGYARADSVAALNFWFWRGYTGAIWDAHPEFAALRTFPLPVRLTPAFERALLAAAEAAAKEQIKAVGDVDEPLGRVFRIGHGGPSLPLGGATIQPNGQTNGSDTVIPDYDATLRAFDFTPTDKNGERLAREGSQAMRLVVWGDGKLESCRCMRSASRPRRGRISATRCRCLAGASSSPRCSTATT